MKGGDPLVSVQAKNKNESDTNDPVGVKTISSPTEAKENDQQPQFQSNIATIENNMTDNASLATITVEEGEKTKSAGKKKYKVDHAVFTH